MEPQNRLVRGASHINCDCQPAVRCRTNGRDTANQIETDSLLLKVLQEATFPNLFVQPGLLSAIDAVDG